MSEIRPDTTVEVEHRGQTQIGIVDRVESVPDSLNLLRVILQVSGEFRQNELFHVVNEGEKFRAKVLEIWRQGEIQKLVVQVEIPEDR